MTNNLPGFKHLKDIGPFSMSLKDATPETIEKIKDTVRYVMRTYPERDLKQVLRVTTASLLAEQKVAKHMEGQYYSGEENLDEPFTYAFDVLSNIKYQGLRLEVKCSFSGKWINVRDRTRPSHTGINLDSFYMHEVADLLVVFRTIETETNTFYYDLGVICTREMLAPSAGLVHKGQKGTWYMHKSFNDNDAPFFYSKGKI